MEILRLPRDLAARVPFPRGAPPRPAGLALCAGARSSGAAVGASATHDEIFFVASDEDLATAAEAGGPPPPPPSPGGGGAGYPPQWLCVATKVAPTAYFTGRNAAAAKSDAPGEQQPEQQPEDGWTFRRLVSLPAADAAVTTQLVLNRQATLLAILGPRFLVVVQCGRDGATGSATADNVLTLRQSVHGQPLEGGDLCTCAWHPLADDVLVSLDSGHLRFHYFWHALDAAGLDVGGGGDDGRFPGYAGRGVSDPPTSLTPPRGGPAPRRFVRDDPDGYSEQVFFEDTVDLPLPQSSGGGRQGGSAVVDFAFGGDAHPGDADRRSRPDWGPFSVYVLYGTGRVFLACPLAPRGVFMPSTDTLDELALGGTSEQSGVAQRWMRDCWAPIRRRRKGRGVPTDGRGAGSGNGSGSGGGSIGGISRSSDRGRGAAVTVGLRARAGVGGVVASTGGATTMRRSSSVRSRDAEEEHATEGLLELVTRGFRSPQWGVCGSPEDDERDGRAGEGDGKGGATPLATSLVSLRDVEFPLAIVVRGWSDGQVDVNICEAPTPVADAFVAAPAEAPDAVQKAHGLSSSDPYGAPENAVGPVGWGEDHLPGAGGVGEGGGATGAGHFQTFQMVLHERVQTLMQPIHPASAAADTASTLGLVLDDHDDLALFVVAPAEVHRLELAGDRLQDLCEQICGGGAPPPTSVGVGGGASKSTKDDDAGDGNDDEEDGLDLLSGTCVYFAERGDEAGAIQAFVSRALRPGDHRLRLLRADGVVLQVDAESVAAVPRAAPRTFFDAESNPEDAQSLMQLHSDSIRREFERAETALLRPLRPPGTHFSEDSAGAKQVLKFSNDLLELRLKPLRILHVQLEQRKAQWHGLEGDLDRGIRVLNKKASALGAMLEATSRKAAACRRRQAALSKRARVLCDLVVQLCERIRPAEQAWFDELRSRSQHIASMLAQMSHLERSVASRLAQIAEGKKSGEGGGDSGKPTKPKKRTLARRPWDRPARNNLAPRHAGMVPPAIRLETPEISAQDGAVLRQALQGVGDKLARLQVKVERVGEATGL